VVANPPTDDGGTDGDDSAATAQESVELEVGEYTFDAVVAGPDDGAVVFLLHGFPQTNQSWDEVIPAMAEAGYRVVAPNLRGYSPGARPPEPELYTMDLLTADVVGMADALGVDQFHVVGHDWGAAATWGLAMSHPDRVLSIVPVSGAHPQAVGAALAERAAEDDRPQGERPPSYLEVFGAEGAEEMFLENDAALLRGILSGPWFTEEEVQNYVDHFNEPGAMTGALNWLRSGSRGMEIAPVTIPTMSVWSTEDVTLGRIGAELSGDFVEGPYRFEILEGVSHWIPDEAPVELNALLLEHLETHS
jgi:pimeloyl-ACP methyl ester carboxylesterase